MGNGGSLVQWSRIQTRATQFPGLCARSPTSAARASELRLWPTCSLSRFSTNTTPHVPGAGAQTPAHTCTQMHVRAHTHTCVHTLTRVHTQHMQVHTRKHAHTGTHMCAHAQMYTHTHAHAQTHTQAHTHVHTHAPTHMHTRAHTHPPSFPHSFGSLSESPLGYPKRSLLSSCSLLPATCYPVSSRQLLTQTRTPVSRQSQGWEQEGTRTGK